MMTTVYLTEEKSLVDHSHIMDSVLLSLRKELRTDLDAITTIDWDESVNQMTEKLTL